MEGIDINAAIQQVMEQCGVGQEEAATLVAQAIQQRANERNAQPPETSIFSLRTDKERAEYMRRLRENAKAVWIPEAWKQAESMANAVNENGLTAEQQFMANMRAKNPGNDISLLRDAKGAADWFKKKRGS
ncbi:hypothetical protein GCM10011513_36930 [Franconibacter daqui]|uniref:hypothetical protein n=1 Tax=Franconibacter daqui TaxID=2047724 RepID=UPI0016691EC7|nr:hypothetical protein [Franconibacter daqui]GGD35753.1 hypothetical protein GCM10011513_36930 [Franconibacter daqui]